MFRRRRKPEDEEDYLKQLQKDYLSTFGTESGRRVLLDLIEQTGIFKTSVEPGKQTENTFFREGQRDIGLMILDKLQVKDMDKLQEFADV